MSRFLRLALLAASASASLAAPTLAQTAADEQRFRMAQQRYDRETQIYRQEQARYDAARQRSGRGYYGGGYGGQGYGSGYYDQRDRTDSGYAPAYPPQGSYSQGYPPQGGYAPQGGYGQRDDGYGDRDENGYDPARDYRAGNYQERVLSADERVYAGNDGRYYCKRSDGTTGLIVGGAAGGILGNVIQGGHSRVLGTLLGGAAGAFAGKAIDQNNSQVRCR